MIEKDSLSTPGARIRQSRLKIHLTIRGLAQITGLSPEGISYLESDKYRPLPPTLSVLSVALGTTICYLGCYENLPENTLGQRIKKARLYHGWTDQELAHKLGFDESTIRKWENDIWYPSEKTITLLEKFIYDSLVHI